LIAGIIIKNTTSSNIGEPTKGMEALIMGFTPSPIIGCKFLNSICGTIANKRTNISAMIHGKKNSALRENVSNPNRIAIITTSKKTIWVTAIGVCGNSYVFKKSPIFRNTSAERRKKKAKYRIETIFPSHFPRMISLYSGNVIVEKRLPKAVYKTTSATPTAIASKAAIHASCLASAANPDGNIKIELPTVNIITKMAN
jgi:hypothetical protein